MKKIIFPIVLLTLIFSCNKDEEEENSNGHIMTAQVDNNKWTAVTYQASIYDGATTVIGTASDGSTITININTDSVGLYSMNETSAHTGTFTPRSGKGFSTKGGSTALGEVLFEVRNTSAKEITGSFQFIGVRSADDSSINISNGRFVKLIYSETPISSEINSLTTKLNGANWTASQVRGFLAFEKLFINATGADGVQVLSFEIPEETAPGKYELNYFTKYKAQYTASDNGKHYAVSGTLEIVSNNLVKKELIGKFDIYMEEHEGFAISRFTEGNFEVIYE